MKKMICIIVCLFSQFAGASTAPMLLSCHVSTRVVAGELSALIDVEKGKLKVSFEKHHALDKSQNYKFEDSNLTEAGTSALSWGSVSFAKQNSGKYTIVGTGTIYDRATPVGAKTIEIQLNQKSGQSRDEIYYSLVGLKAGGKMHYLEGISDCKLITLENQSAFAQPLGLAKVKVCKIPPQADCTKSPKRICCDCDASGNLSCF